MYKCLSTWNIDDANIVVELINNISYESPNIPKPYTLENAVEWINKQKCDVNTYKSFSICSYEHGIVGEISLTFEATDQAYIGCWINNQYTSNHYATHAINELLTIAWSYKLKKVYSGCSILNIPYQKALMYCGFSLSKEKFIKYYDNNTTKLELLKYEISI